MSQDVNRLRFSGWGLCVIRGGPAGPGARVAKTPPTGQTGGGDFIMDVKKDNAMYMHIAQIASERSYAVRLKVGCVIVKNNAIISIGWNGMPTGYDNCCEMQVDGKLVTRPEVQHAELNAISKLAFNGFSSRGASIFITHSPCIHCALLIQKCGIEHVYYHEIYRDDSGIRFLQHAGIDVEQL